MEIIVYDIGIVCEMAIAASKRAWQVIPCCGGARIRLCGSKFITGSVAVVYANGAALLHLLPCCNDMKCCLMLMIMNSRKDYSHIEDRRCLARYSPRYHCTNLLYIFAPRYNRSDLHVHPDTRLQPGSNCNYRHGRVARRWFVRGRRLPLRSRHSTSVYLRVCNS